MPSWEAKQYIFEQIGYQPNEGQLPVHKANNKKKLVWGGVRAGKSTVGAGEIAADYGHGPLYWLLGADYEMCREEFGYLVDFFHKMGVVKNCHFPGRDQCQLYLEPDILIETKSAKYPEKIAAKAVRGILMCEAAQMSYDIFTRCIERLTELDGFLVMTGTLETSLDWYSDKGKEYHIPDNPDGGISFSLASWTNTKIFPGGRQDTKILAAEQTLGVERFSERFGGVPIKPKGLVFGEYKSTFHTGSYPIDPKEPIFLGIDEGHFPGVYAVEFIQFINDHMYVVDEIYQQYLITEQIIDICKKHPYWKNVEGGAIDIGAKQHHGQKPVWDIWRSQAGLSLGKRRIPVDDGTDRLRAFLIPHPVSGEVQIHIDSKCRGIISEFGGCAPPPSIEQGGIYKMKMDREGTVLSEKPDDKHNHGIKALIYAVVSKYGLAPKGKGPAVSYRGTY